MSEARFEIVDRNSVTQTELAASSTQAPVDRPLYVTCLYIQMRSDAKTVSCQGAVWRRQRDMKITRLTKRLLTGVGSLLLLAVAMSVVGYLSAPNLLQPS